MDRKRRTAKYLQPEHSASSPVQTPTRQAPPKKTPPRQEPPKQIPPRQEPPKQTPPRQEPPTPHKKRNPAKHHQQGFQPQKQMRHVKRRRLIFWILSLFLACVFLFSAWQVVQYFVQSHKAKQEEQMIQELIAQSETLTETPQAAPASPTPSPTQSVPVAAAERTNDEYFPTRTTQPVRKMPDVLIQFTKALAINPETVGQLKMGENISTYVVQRDNAYYLRHSFSGEYSFSGTIFLDVSCSIYPQSRNLIIHGHNMQDGTAFGKLIRYENIDYLNRYPIIEFSTLYESAQYIPFAVLYYSVDPESSEYLDLYRVNAMSDDTFLQFVSDVQYRSIYHIPVNVSKSDRILTVTTCATTDADIRFAVIAVKRDRQ